LFVIPLRFAEKNYKDTEYQCIIQTFLCFFFDVFRVFLRQSVKKIHLLLAIENHTEQPKSRQPE